MARKASGSYCCEILAEDDRREMSVPFRSEERMPLTMSDNGQCHTQMRKEDVAAVTRTSLEPEN